MTLTTTCWMLDQVKILIFWVRQECQAMVQVLEPSPSHLGVRKIQGLTLGIDMSFQCHTHLFED
jgi:hypothetical protein